MRYDFCLGKLTKDWIALLNTQRRYDADPFVVMRINADWDVAQIDNELKKYPIVSDYLHYLIGSGLCEDEFTFSYQDQIIDGYVSIEGDVIRIDVSLTISK